MLTGPIQVLNLPTRLFCILSAFSLEYSFIFLFFHLSPYFFFLPEIRSNKSFTCILMLINRILTFLSYLRADYLCLFYETKHSTYINLGVCVYVWYFTSKLQTARGKGLDPIHHLEAAGRTSCAK